MHYIHSSEKLDGSIHTWHIKHETSKSEKKKKLKSYLSNKENLNLFYSLECLHFNNYLDGQDGGLLLVENTI